MKNLLILQPTPIVAISTSRGSGAANLLTPDPREVWVDSATGTATIDLDFGTPRVIDTVFLGHILPPQATATWTITGGLSGPTSTTLAASSSLRVPDVNGRAPALSHAFWKGIPANVRYLRLSVTQPAGSPPLSAGIVMAGRALVPTWNHEWGSGRRPIDTGSTTALPDGGFAVVEGVRKASWFWTLGDLTNDELDALWETALDRGESRPILVVEDPDRTAGLRRRLHYGLFRQFREYERSTPGRTRWELRIEDWGADEAAPISSLPIDLTPDAFRLPEVLDVERGTLVQSDAVTVSGIEGAAPIAVSDGEYQVDGGPWSSVPGLVLNGAVVRVRLTSSTAYWTRSTATLTIGGVSADFSIRTVEEPADSVPDTFAFIASTNVLRSTVVESDAITVSGVNRPTPISITGGEYRIDAGNWTSAAGTVVNGAVVRVRLISAATYSSAREAVLTIGGVVGTFSVTTRAQPTAPAAPAVQLTAGDRQATVAWVDGDDNGSPISTHSIFVDGVLVTTTGQPSPIQVTGLQNGVPVSIEVTANNGVGPSPKSPAKSVTPSGLVTRVEIMGDLTDVSTVNKPPLAIGDPIPLKTNGMVLKVTLASNVAIDATKVAVFIDRPGWENKVPTTRRDLSYGNGLLRRATPNDASALSAGANSWFVTLDNPVYGPDTIFSVVFFAGFYAGSEDLLITTGVARSDTLPYPQPFVGFLAPPFQVSDSTNPTVAIDVTGMSNFARDGREFDTVEAWARVNGVDGPAVSTQTMGFSRWTPDLKATPGARLPGFPVPAYRLDPSAAALSDGAGGVRVRVYPFCGPVWESWVSGTPFPTANVEAELPFTRDSAGKFSKVYAWPNQSGTARIKVVASAITNKLTVTAWEGEPITIGTELYCGSAKRTVTGLDAGTTGGTGSYTVAPTGTVNSTTWSTGAVQTTEADPGFALSFHSAAAATQAIIQYNAARTAGLAHNDSDGGVLMFRNVAGSALGQHAGSYSTMNQSISGGVQVPLELRAAAGTTSQLCRIRGVQADGTSIANKQLTGRVWLRNLTLDSSGVTAPADNMIFDGSSGTATTRAAAVSHLHMFDCDVIEATNGGSNHALFRFGWRNDFRVSHKEVLSVNNAGYTASYQCFVRTVGSSYANTNASGGLQVRLLAGARMVNLGLGGQGRITLADGGEVIDGWLMINSRIDIAGNNSGVAVLDCVAPLSIGVGQLNFMVRQGGTPKQPGIRISGDGTTAPVANILQHHVSTDGGIEAGNVASPLNARLNLGYNDQTLSAPEKRGQKIGCVFPSLNNKTDTFPAQETPPNTAFAAGVRYYAHDIVHDGNATLADRTWYVCVRSGLSAAGDLANAAIWKVVGKLNGTIMDRNPIRTGNWWIRHAVGDLGNVICNTADAQNYLQTGGFMAERLGRNSVIAADYTTYYKQPTGGGTFSATDWGDYTPKSKDSGDAVDSPLLNRIPAGCQVRPFDLFGYPTLNNGKGAAGPVERAKVS